MISMKDTTSYEIRVRQATARSITSDLADIWKDDNIASAAQSDSESWILEKEEEKCLHAFEMWVFMANYVSTNSTFFIARMCRTRFSGHVGRFHNGFHLQLIPTTAAVCQAQR